MPYKTLLEALSIFRNADFMKEVSSWPPSYFYSQIQTPLDGISKERKRILWELCVYYYRFDLPSWLCSDLYPKRKLPNTDFSDTGKDDQLGD